MLAPYTVTGAAFPVSTWIRWWHILRITMVEMEQQVLLVVEAVHHGYKGNE